MTTVLHHVEAVVERIHGLEQRVLELEQGIMTRIGAPAASPPPPGAALPRDEAPSDDGIA